MANDEADGGDGEHEEFLHLFRRGLRFTEELLTENEKLRFRLASLDVPDTTGEATEVEVVEKTMAELAARVAQLEADRQQMLTSFEAVKSLNQDYQSRYSDIEEEHSNLANLYIALFQMHSTTAFTEILRVVAEIVINLVGVLRFGIYIVDGSRLGPVFAEGEPLSNLSDIVLDEGPIGQAIAKRAIVADASQAPCAIVPLVTGDVLVGAIVIQELLVQKKGFSSVDHELFLLLRSHAATALLSALFREKIGPDAVKQVLNLTTVRSLVEN